MYLMYNQIVILSDSNQIISGNLNFIIIVVVVVAAIIFFFIECQNQ